MPSVGSNFLVGQAGPGSIAVQASLQRTGFKRVRVERFMGRHWLKKSEVRLALRWFRGSPGGF
jgi:hypothetical protein